MGSRTRPVHMVFAAMTFAAGCNKPTETMDASPQDVVTVDAQPRNLLETVNETQTFTLPGLSRRAYVLRTEGDVPHVYAADRNDMARVMGFTLARHRYFMMDMVRRLALGTVSSLLGEAALRTDMENRGAAQTFVAERFIQNATPAQLAELDAFAAGINAYVEAVRRNSLPPPSEYQLAAPLLGQTVGNLMQPFDRRSMGAVLATLLYQLGFETGDMERGRFEQALPTAFASAPKPALRRAGARTDIFEHVLPMKLTSSARGWGLETGTMADTRTPGARNRARPNTPAVGRIPAASMERLHAAMERIRIRLARDEHRGSNAWAVAGARTPDGAALLAADGHLGLTIPSLFYQVGLDTRFLSGDAAGIEQIGLTIPGFPGIALGTNGKVAWGQTQLIGDITDWYREEIRLGADGLPADSFFQGSWRPLVKRDETFVVANVPVLNSRGRTEAWQRWETFDGRWIAEIEGRSVSATETLNPGEQRVMVVGHYVVPSDTDRDGKITAISFDYAGLDGGDLIGAVEGFGNASNVQQFREATRRLVAYSGNLVAADSSGQIFYTSYQAVPCREYLRASDRSWLAGGNPYTVLDGTRFGGFRIPITNGVVDEGPGATDPYACVLPFERTPQSLSPDRGFVATANNDPGGASFDDSLTNDPFYQGGPWMEGYRVDRVSNLLREAITNRAATPDTMKRIQADTRSPLGEQFLVPLLEAVERARALATTNPGAGTPEARLAALYTANAADFDDAIVRLRAWRDAGGFQTPSGVDTFYSTTRQGDAANAVATTIFNAWIGKVFSFTFDDEAWPPGVWGQVSPTAHLRTMQMILDGRGPGNPRNLASWDPDTQESVYWDRTGTADVTERSREVILQALRAALDFLATPSDGKGRGGFGTADRSQWIWGLRHWVHFDSLLGSYLSDDPMFAFLRDRFSITTTTLPLATGLMTGDPRRELPGFPRAGDNYVVDAANPGLDGTDFTYGSGPAYRYVFALKNGQFRGWNILPGGQSGLINSPNFADQARRWLANDYLELQLTPQDVVAHATGRETFDPG